MREELVDYLKGLSDREYQREAWVEKNFQKGEYDELDYTIHFLYDDTVLASNPRSTIGLILESEEESKLIANLIFALDAVFETHGLELSDEEYIGTAGWEEVVRSAKAAWNLLKTNDKKRTPGSAVDKV